MRSACRRDRNCRKPVILLIPSFPFLSLFLHFPFLLSFFLPQLDLPLFPDRFLPPFFISSLGQKLGDPSSKPRFVYLLNATNNICFYFCAGPSPALHFLKAGHLWRTAGWMIERKQNGLGGRRRGENGRGRERESEAGYSGQIIVKGRTFCPPATLFLIKGVL